MVEAATANDGDLPGDHGAVDCIGAAASEMDAQTLCQMVVDLAEMLRTGAGPAKVRRLRPVP